PTLPKLRRRALFLYAQDSDGDASLAWAARGLGKLRQEIVNAERAAVEKAHKKLTDLREDHRKLTLVWAKASELPQPVLKAEIDRLEAEIGIWQPRTLPVSERLQAVYDAENELRQEREQLLAEWPTLEARAKGEAFRRLFGSVTLRWDRVFKKASTK